MTKPKFLLGVGAQKAGTSFLYRALCDHPSVALSTPKEMHVFDAYFMPEVNGHFRKRRFDELKQRFDKESKVMSPAAKKKTSAMLRHLHMYYDLAEYPAYFRDLAEGKQLTGDITPSYSMLNAEHFDAIRNLLKDDFDIKVVFLMRDPIDRIFSQIRMDERNKKRNGVVAEVPAHEHFSGAHWWPKHTRRTEYHKTILALEDVFPPEDIHYQFYENLFNADSFFKLQRFLGIEGLTPDFETRVNASPTKNKLSQQQIGDVRKSLDPIYTFCMVRFGGDRVRALWPYA